MARSVDYFFTLMSPWAYLGHKTLVEIVRRHGAEINYKPVPLLQVFDETGGLPLPKRHPARQRYRLMDLQRWRDRRGLPLNLRPRHWPFDAKLADRAAIAIVVAHGDPQDYIDRAFSAVWSDELNVADEAVVADLLARSGHDPAPLLKAARATTTEALYALNLENAVASGVFGSPSYVLNQEVFWGQDRLDFLDEALASNRPSYAG